MCWGQFQLLKIRKEKKKPSPKVLLSCRNEKSMLSKLNGNRCEILHITLKTSLVTLWQVVKLS